MQIIKGPDHFSHVPVKAPPLRRRRVPKAELHPGPVQKGFVIPTIDVHVQRDRKLPRPRVP